MYKINLLPVWLLFLTQVATLPTMVDEVVPGPGLPSLASLNITSAELFAMPDPPDSASQIFRWQKDHRNAYQLHSNALFLQLLPATTI
ncbi:hypothetical protein ACEPPN_005304 [Leptodophora sp. 'Broadleaf-Isolate-01']